MYIYIITLIEIITTIISKGHTRAIAISMKLLTQVYQKIIADLRAVSNISHEISHSLSLYIYIYRERERYPIDNYIFSFKIPWLMYSIYVYIIYIYIYIYSHLYPSIIPVLSHYYPYKTIVNHSKPASSPCFFPHLTTTFKKKNNRASPMRHAVKAVKATTSSSSATAQ